MDSPAEKNNAHGDSPACLDISPERLNSLSPSELADAMEEALDYMTEETYSPDVIRAYLDALDQKASIPAHVSAEAAYANFQQKWKALSVKKKTPESTTVSGCIRKRRSVWRMGLAAALLVFFMFGGMMIAQAFGLDVFGAIARWTEEAFSFGDLPADDASHNPAGTEVPAEYREVKAALEERGIPFRFPRIPEGFEVVDSLMYVVPDTENIGFSIEYMRDEAFISFKFAQHDGLSKTVYKKDNTDVEIYKYNNMCHYIFGNNGDIVSAWITNDMEYSISTNTKSVDLKKLIRSCYKE